LTNDAAIYSFSAKGTENNFRRRSVLSPRAKTGFSLHLSLRAQPKAQRGNLFFYITQKAILFALHFDFRESELCRC